MPRKISDSIRRNFSKLRDVFHENSEKAASKPAKKTAGTVQSAPAQANTPATPDGVPDSSGPKKPGQPWYRHRQRW
jgi:hypothetical protein